MIMILMWSLEKWQKNRKLICSVTGKELRTCRCFRFGSKSTRAFLFLFLFFLLLFLFLLFMLSYWLLIFVHIPLIEGGKPRKSKLIVRRGRGYRIMLCLVLVCVFPSLSFVSSVFFDFIFPFHGDCLVVCSKNWGVTAHVQNIHCPTLYLWRWSFLWTPNTF